MEESLFIWELVTEVYVSVRWDSMTLEQVEMFFIILLNVSF